MRGSFRLAPLISAIGVSIALQNYVQLVQGARPKPGGQIVSGGFNLFSLDGFDVRVSWLQIIIVLVTVVLMARLHLADRRDARSVAASAPASRT